jgi:hypothetical protein
VTDAERIKQLAEAASSRRFAGGPPQITFGACTTKDTALQFGEAWVAAMRERGHKTREVLVHYRDLRGVWSTTLYEVPRWWRKLLAALAWSGTVWGSGQVR